MQQSTRNTARRAGTLAALGVTAMLLSGCLGAVAIPLATTAAVNAYTNSTVDRTMSYAERVNRMNCSQLRTEYSRLGRNVLGRTSIQWSGRRAAVVSAASNRGCRLSS